MRDHVQGDASARLRQGRDCQIQTRVAAEAQP
jgi:hypothetical protein